MRKWPKLLCSAFCFLNIALPSTVLAKCQEDSFEKSEDQYEQFSREDKEHILTFMTEDSVLQPVRMSAGLPVNSLHLYLADNAGHLIKDAQFITTIIDRNGNCSASRATPYKYGYYVDLDPLPAGQYRVEAEIVTGAQLWTDEFTFNKV